MTLVIRPMQESDIGFVVKGNELIDGVSHINHQRGLNASYIHQDILCDNPKAFVDIVMDADVPEQRPVAFILYSFFYLASRGQVIWLSKVYLDPLYRKAGISLLIKQHLQKKYPSVPAIYGSIATTNSVARHFFSSIGAERLDEFFMYMLERAGHE